MRRTTAKRLNADELKEHALRLLSGRSLSVGQLRDRLRRRAERQEDVGPLLERLAELGLTDDARLASSFASSRASAGTFGGRRVLTDLLRKRVARPVAERAVQQAYATTDETGLVAQWLERKYRGKDLCELLQDPARLSSIYRRLRVAGFGSAASIGVLKRYASQASELEDLDDSLAHEAGGPPGEIED